MIILLAWLLLVTNTLCQLDWNPACSPKSEEMRIDCHPDKDASPERCAARGCCWANQLSGAFNRAPACYFPDNYPGFEIVSADRHPDKDIYRLKRTQTTSHIYEPINELTFEVIKVSEHIARIRVTDTNNQRFEVPDVVQNLPIEYSGPVSFTHSMHTDNDLNNWWGASIKRFGEDAETLFDSSIAPLIYSDQFIQFSTKLPSQYVYGLGEHRTQFQISANWRKMSFWTRDQATVRDDNLYGNHPFLMSFDKHNRAYGYFMLNANAMEVRFTPMPSITYRTIGGIIDLFVFMGPTPDEVIQQYWTVVGQPLMAPYWSLGYHLCRWGYQTLANLTEIYNNLKALDFPYDVQWTDIDALDGKRIFTYDRVLWTDLPAFVQQLHANDMKYISINDPGIACDPALDYPTYTRGLDLEVYVKWANNSGYLVGEVWPGLTVYPDFTHPNALQWWTDELRIWHEVLPQDGLWIDMNEVSSFIYGSVDGCPLPEDNPPYVPEIFETDLWAKTICVSALQNKSNQYNLHSLYGHQWAMITYRSFRTLFPEDRPFVITRASYSGSGKWTSKWGGDNFATFNDMYYSLTDIMNFNIFGFPQTGDDVCGFIDDTTPELCTRWHQAGLVYTFFRNHNLEGKVPNDPTAFAPEFRAIMKDANFMRYELLPYMYTLLYKATTESRVLHRSLMFEYAEDKQTHSIDSQVLFGSALMSAPVFHDQQRQIHVYFPVKTDEKWFEFSSGQPVSVKQGGEWKTFDAPLDKLWMFMRSGHIIPTHIITNRSRNAMQNRQSPFRLYASLADGPGTSMKGNLFWDNGVHHFSMNMYSIIEFDGGDGFVNIQTIVHNYQQAPIVIDELVVFGVSKAVRLVELDGTNVDYYIFNAYLDQLIISNLQITITSNSIHQITWYY